MFAQVALMENTAPVVAHVCRKRQADIRETELQHSGKKKAQTKRRRALNKSSKLRVSDVMFMIQTHLLAQQGLPQ